MREILFRAKRVKNNQWVEGSYHKHETRQVCPCGDKLSPDEIKHLIIRDTFADWNMPREIEATEVIAETVGQFTGLTDKNNNKIFEGDILSYEYGSDDCEKFEYFAVSYNQGKWILTNPEGFSNEVAGWVKTTLVIGNIYDNPELLIGGNENE